MSLREALVAELPFLRRYARALTGSQSLGDAAVREVLEALLEAPEEIQSDKPVRTELFRIFHRLWQPEIVEPLASKGRSGVIAQFPIFMRQSLLLTAVEGFSEEETALILDLESDAIGTYVRETRSPMRCPLTF
jgi:DNA-directed RNA polymerase specialized sigma24 family protein